VLSAPTPHHYTSECNERWLHLLAFMFLPADVNVTPLTNDAKVTALVNQRPPSYTNNMLRTTYPSLLQQPSYILKVFLNFNSMALALYCATLATDTYGVLRLKLMGCVVAINRAVENVDSLLSRSDIYYIAHVGGILGNSQRRFSSDIFIIFDSVDVVNQLAGLFDSKMSVLISPPPRQPQKLSSAEGWSNKFKSKLPTVTALDQAAKKLLLSINAVVIESPPFGCLVMTKQWCNALVVPTMCINSRYPPPQQGARFEFNIQYDEWSEYIEPVAYSVQEQQRIINWSTIRGLKFSGSGRTYIQCLRLFHTSDRPIVIGDNIVFLYCPQCVFTPDNPSRTLFSVTHVLYTIVHTRDSVLISIVWKFCATTWSWNLYFQDSVPICGYLHNIFANHRH